MKGYAQAAAEYEAKLTDPFKDEEIEQDEDWFDFYEEKLLERQMDDYLWG